MCLHPFDLAWLLPQRCCSHVRLKLLRLWHPEQYSPLRQRDDVKDAARTVGLRIIRQGVAQQCLIEKLPAACRSDPEETWYFDPWQVSEELWGATCVCAVVGRVDVSGAASRVRVSTAGSYPAD